MKKLFPLFLILFGCATTSTSGAFSYRFADNRAEDLEPILQALPSPSAPAVSNASGTPLVIATTTSETPEVIAVDIQSGEIRWRTSLDAYSRPEVHGDVVMTSDRSNVVALDLGSGQELWRKDLESRVYVGAARSGNTLAWVASIGASGGETREGRIEAVNARTGRRAWVHEISGVLGKPAAEAELFLVPWDRQNIAILNAATGVEQARLRSNDDVIAWVESRPEGVFYGHRGIYRLGPGSATGNKEDAFHRPHPLPDLPREPELHDDAFYPNPGHRSARGRIRVYFAPEAQGASPVSVVGEMFYYVYYRYVFAYDGEGTIRWAHKLNQDVVNAEVTPGGLLTVGEGGAFVLLSAESGAEVWTGGLETTLGSAGIDAANFTAPAGSAEAPDLRTALAEIIGDPDNRLVPARAHAVSLLAALEAPEITQDLLDLYVQRSTPGALREAIGSALQTRSVGTEFLVSALDQHYNYLEETPVPPFALIIPALLQQEVRGAVSGLVSHLMDHETPVAVMPLVARAIVDLGDESVVPPLRAFLVRYHQDTTFAEAPQTLAVVAEGLFRHGGEDGRTMIQAIAAAPHVSEGLSTGIRGLFEREAAAATATAQAEANAAAEAARAAAAAERAARPSRLSQAQINEVFAAQTEALRTCVEAELERNPRLGQLRFVFIIENTGRTRDMRYTPNSPELQSCLAPTVDALVFPRFQDRRQRARFVVNLRASSSSENASAEVIEDGTWWARSQRRAGSSDAALGRPWWQPRTVAGAVQAPEGTPPEGGEGTPPEGGEGTPPEGGEGTPPEGGEGGEGGEIWWLPEE